ncbi:MAG: hypothetical protein EAZ55_13895 [Cytophagales bacterium]|nr:MAG: hypothetical protein EAZ55_13895 [Cytophagales bacterium]
MKSSVLFHIIGLSYLTACHPYDIRQRLVPTQKMCIIWYNKEGKKKSNDTLCLNDKAFINTWENYLSRNTINKSNTAIAEGHIQAYKQQIPIYTIYFSISEKWFYFEDQPETFYQITTEGATFLVLLKKNKIHYNIQ